MADRAAIFIDGSNWYHSLGENGVQHRIDLDYATISEKLVQNRQWVSTRYYLGPMKQDWDRETYAFQQKFLRSMQGDDERISFHPGRLELRPQENRLSTKLKAYLAENTDEVSSSAFDTLRELAEDHSDVYVRKEKEVDVKLAVDMYRMAVEDKYDAGYLLSADGDFVPVVKAVRDFGCDVYVASPNPCTALQHAAKSYITLDQSWFDDCYRDLGSGHYVVDMPRPI